MPILDVGCMHLPTNEMSRSIGNDVPLAPLDLLAGIIAAGPTTFCRFHRHGIMSSRRNPGGTRSALPAPQEPDGHSDHTDRWRVRCKGPPFRYPRGLSSNAGRVGAGRFGRIELDTKKVERAIRPITMHESLCTPSSSVCKHWNRVGVDNTTRATFPGHRRFDRLRRQVVRTDLMRCTANDLHSREDTGFDKATYRVVCDA
jgi:hypothetical protein